VQRCRFRRRRAKTDDGVRTGSEQLGGYEVNITDQDKGASKYDPAHEWDWDREQSRQVYKYYKVPGYWAQLS
jgi:hypothetical protein